MTLLIVNDVELVVSFLQTEIPWEQYGITKVRAAYNADEARAALAAEPADLLLCDIEMPGDDGIALLRWVKEQGLDCDCVFLTCHANFEYLHEAMHLECQDYVLFPAPPETIGAAVQKVVARRKERRHSDSLQEYGRQWMAEHLESVPHGSALSAQDIVSNTVRYILENIASPTLSVNEIAEKNYLSLSYLSRLFKREKGISISQYITKQRMELAAQLLADEKNTASSVCYLAGYSNYPYFTTTFRKYWGVTPGQYRQQQATEHEKQG